MSQKRHISTEEARSIGTQLNIDWAQIDLEQFRRGLEVELEHGARDPETNVTGDDLVLTGKIAWAHLKEIREFHPPNFICFTDNPSPRPPGRSFTGRYCLPMR